MCIRDSGYTSYESLNDLDTRFSPFAELKKRMDKHVAKFAQECHFDLNAVSYTHLDVYKRQHIHAAHAHIIHSKDWACLLYTSRCV